MTDNSSENQVDTLTEQLPDEAIVHADTQRVVEQEISFLSAFEGMLAQLENAIGYQFRDRSFLRRALTHRSFANEQPDPRPLHNEALEFLGDAVLEFLISSWLLELHPTHTEGTLSKMRAYAVSAVNLQKHAARLHLGSYLLLNRGEEKTGGRNKMALQVDAYEALIAAIYLDGGIEAAKQFIRREFATTFIEIDPQNLTGTDYKTALQERLQSYGFPTPQYAIVESLGPDHKRVFQVELRVNSYCLATGEGTTIKGAHQAAARAALSNLEKELDKLREGLAIVEIIPVEPTVASPAESFAEASQTEIPVEPETPEAPPMNENESANR
ncbi:MAG: ribonuclease III [Blastocatellia bacterium]|nr:ribonuclease III [Blastocatellia bacterium]